MLNRKRLTIQMNCLESQRILEHSSRDWHRRAHSDGQISMTLDLDVDRRGPFRSVSRASV